MKYIIHPKMHYGFRLAILPVSVIALLLGASASMAAEEPIRLAGSSPWQVNYADDSCRLVRQFGEGDQTVILALDRFEPQGGFRTILIGKMFEHARAGRTVTIVFGPDGRPQRSDIIEATTGDIPTLIFARAMGVAPQLLDEDARAMLDEEAGKIAGSDDEDLDPARIAAVETILIEASGFDPVLLETGSLGPPFAAFDQCLDELLTHWGVDIERHRQLSRRVRPTESPGRWVVSRDYPRNLLMRGSEGLVHFRLSVDQEGNVADCHIQQSTRPVGFDEAVCTALRRRAHFEPALDADGIPIASYYISTVMFQAR